ncbi:unnamed protein product [Amaranthus hypochondriacus]
MAITPFSFLPQILLPFLICSLLLPQTLSEIRFTEIRSNSQPIIPFDEFGFSHSGFLNLNVTLLSLRLHNLQSSPVNNPNDLSLLGFFLCTRDSWSHVIDQLDQNDIVCPLQSDLIKPVFTFDRLNNGGLTHFNLSIQITNPNLFALVFSNCIPNLQISMDVLSSMYNLNPKTNSKSFLSIEAEDKSFIKRTGTAHGWDVLFYIFSFLKGISLFTLIVLIGTGWSFLKPYLQDKEKKVLMIVIPLQVIANVAQVVIDETGPYGVDSFTCKQVFLLVDIVCCCSVLFPIVWSIEKLRAADKSDGKAKVNLMKLTLFKHYYVVVICYIYFTRVIVYGLETITSYRFEWTSVVAGELGTVLFYVFTGYNFRPKPCNPYFVIDDEEEEAALEMLRMDGDEF